MTPKIFSILDHAGTVIVKDFAKVLPVAIKVAVDAEPIVDLAFPGIAALFNSTLAAVGNAEATGIAAANGAQSGQQKAAAVVQALSPLAIAYLAQHNIAVNNAVIEEWVDKFVALLKVIPAPAGSPVLPATPAAA